MIIFLPLHLLTNNMIVTCAGSSICLLQQHYCLTPSPSILRWDNYCYLEVALLYLFLASSLDDVYSNHKISGIEEESLIRKYSASFVFTKH